MSVRRQRLARQPDLHAIRPGRAERHRRAPGEEDATPADALEDRGLGGLGRVHVDEAEGRVVVVRRPVAVRPGDRGEPDPRIEQVRPQRDVLLVGRLDVGPAPVPHLHGVEGRVVDPGVVPVAADAPRVAEAARMVDRDEGALGVCLRHDARGAAAAAVGSPVDRAGQPEDVHVAVERRDLAAANRDDGLPRRRELAMVAHGVVIGDRDEVEAACDCRLEALIDREAAVAVYGVRVQVAAVPARAAGRAGSCGVGCRCRRWTGRGSRRGRAEPRGRLDVPLEVARAGPVVEDQARVDDEVPRAGPDGAGKAARGRGRFPDHRPPVVVGAVHRAAQPVGAEQVQGRRVGQVLGPHVVRVPAPAEPQLDGALRDVDREPVVLVAIPVRPLTAQVEQADDGSIPRHGRTRPLRPRRSVRRATAGRRCSCRGSAPPPPPTARADASPGP